MEPLEWAVAGLLAVVIVGCFVYVKDKLSPPAPPPVPPVPAPPVPVPPPIPPPPPAIPTLSFLQAPAAVTAGTATKLTFLLQLSGNPYRREAVTFELVIPNNAGVMTDLLGQTHAGTWSPADGNLVYTMRTSGDNFPDVKAGEVIVEIFIDHVTPAGQPADCMLKATHADTGTSITHAFRGR